MPVGAGEATGTTHVKTSASCRFLTGSVLVVDDSRDGRRRALILQLNFKPNPLRIRPWTTIIEVYVARPQHHIDGMAALVALSAGQEPSVYLMLCTALPC